MVLVTILEVAFFLFIGLLVFFGVAMAILESKQIGRSERHRILDEAHNNNAHRRNSVLTEKLVSIGKPTHNGRYSEHQECLIQEYKELESCYQEQNDAEIQEMTEVLYE